MSTNTMLFICVESLNGLNVEWFVELLTYIIHYEVFMLHRKNKQDEPLVTKAGYGHALGVCKAAGCKPEPVI
jgi:hypothetical protein